MSAGFTLAMSPHPMLIAQIEDLLNSRRIVIVGSKGLGAGAVQNHAAITELVPGLGVHSERSPVHHHATSPSWCGGASSSENVRIELSTCWGFISSIEAIGIPPSSRVLMAFAVASSVFSRASTIALPSATNC